LNPKRFEAFKGKNEYPKRFEAFKGKNEYPIRIEEFKGKKLVVQVLSGFLRLHVSIVCLVY